MTITSAYRYKFLLVFYNNFLTFSTIATKCTYKFPKGCAQLLRRYIKYGMNWLKVSYRYEYLLIFYKKILNLLYYSYEMHVQIFERLRPAPPTRAYEGPEE
jgi:hypothetical protein